MSAILKFVARSAVAILAVGITHIALAVDALPDARFVGFVQEANDFEIGSSNLALQRSSNEAIRGYANRMLIERGEMAGLLSKARSEAGLTGLLRMWVPATRASSRTCTERSAVTRIAGRSRP